MASKPILTTGVALAGAAAIVAATPAIIPTAAQKTYVATASAPADVAPRQMTVADYELMAVTLPGLLHAFFNGHGALVSGERDGDCGEPGASCPTGPLGALYYLGEETLLAGVAVDNFFFEHGPYTAAAYVAEVAGASQDVVEFIEQPWNKVRATFVDAVNAVTGGTESEYSLPAILVHEFIHNGGPLRMVQIVVELIKEVFDPTPPAEGEDDGEETQTPESAVSSLLGDVASPKLDGSGVARLVSLSVSEVGERVAGLGEHGTEVAPQTEGIEGIELTGAKVPSLLPEDGETTGLGDVVKGLKAADEEVDTEKQVEAEAPQTVVPEPKTPEVEAVETEIDEIGADEIEQGEAGAADVDPKTALTDAAGETASDETKSRSELRREAAKERIEERREAAKERAQERREAVKERVDDARSKVRDAVKRATGSSDSDAKKSDKKDSGE